MLVYQTDQHFYYLPKMETTKNWFETWFDSPYYHILYKDRDYSEAERFIGKLVNYFKPGANQAILDLACGKGRHSITLNKSGLWVTGMDISPESIHFAKQFENNRLSFYIHDMRIPFGSNQYHYVFNLFTSFGYFNHTKENNQVLQNIRLALKPGGILLIDFFNATLLQQKIVKEEKKIVDDICFQISRKIEKDKVIKQINFNDKGKNYQFIEQVQLITEKDFAILLQENGFQVINRFGDYNLGAFQPDTSPRLILEARVIK